MGSPNMPDRGRVVALFGVFIIVLGLVVVLGPWKGRPSSAVGRACQLVARNAKRRAIIYVSVELESGRVVNAVRGTRCVVLGESESTTLVRVTDGEYKGMTARVPRGGISLDPPAMP